MGVNCCLEVKTYLPYTTILLSLQLDLEKIRAISWLVFEEDQRPEAIRQGNALMRQFFSMSSPG